MTMSTRLRTFAIAAALLAASAPALAVKPFSATYAANYMGMQGDGRMTIEPAGEHWRYTLTISNSLANLRQSTVFDETDGALRPLSGSDSSKVLIKKVDKNASYDWNKGVATWSGDVKDDRRGPVKLQAGDVDALLLNLALVRDAQAGKPLRYRMVDDGRVRQMSYAVAGKDTIEFGGKSRQATKVVSTSGDKQTILWVVDGLPVPARIVQKEDGKETVDLHLQSLK